MVEADVLHGCIALHLFERFSFGASYQRLLTRRRKPGIGSDGCHAQHAGGTADLLIYEGEIGDPANIAPSQRAIPNRVTGWV